MDKTKLILNKNAKANKAKRKYLDFGNSGGVDFVFHLGEDSVGAKEVLDRNAQRSDRDGAGKSGTG